MSVSFTPDEFSADLFTLDQDSHPANPAKFLKGLDAMADHALDALKKPEDVEKAFQSIENVNLIELSSEDKKNVDQRIHDVIDKWVNVTFGSYSRHVPRERLANQCGPKFGAQYTSVMKEATDPELDLLSGVTDESPTALCPEKCREPLLVYLQTGTLPAGALGESALDMLLLAEQHQLEGLIDMCLDFLIDNLSHQNLDTFLEFTQQTHFPRLELACLNFMKDNRDSISEDLKTKYQEQLSIVEALERGKITLTSPSSRKIEIKVTTFTNQTTNLLKKIGKQFPVTSLILPRHPQNNPFICLREIAPTLKSLQDLIIWNDTPTDSDLPELKNLFPNLTSLGNNSSFLKTFDEVRAYVKNFREPGEEGPESKKPLLRSLDLMRVPNLTDAQLEELAPYLQELHYLSLKSDKITSVVAPKATTVDCIGCTSLTTLIAPEVTEIRCINFQALTTLEVPKATSVDCWGCTALTTLKVPNATMVHCTYCTLLTNLKAPEATTVNCSGCTALATLTVPNATTVHCGGCTALTSVEAPKANEVYCRNCTALTTLEAPQATTVLSSGCPSLKNP